MCDNNVMAATTATKSRSPSTVDYSQVNFFSINDFVPSRETRVSSNPSLQEHLFCSPPLPHPCSSGIVSRSLSPQLIRSTPLKGARYIELDFSLPSSLPSSRPFSDNTVGLTEEDEEEIGDYSYAFTGTFLHQRSNSDPPVSAKTKKSTRHSREEVSDQPFRSRLCALETNKMERPVSFAMAIAENPIQFDEMSLSSHSNHTTTDGNESHYYINVKRKDQGNSRNVSTPSSSPSPPPRPPKSGVVRGATRPPSPLLFTSGRDTPPIGTESHPTILCSTAQRTDSLEDINREGFNKRMPLSVSNVELSNSSETSSFFRTRRSSDPSSLFQKSLESCMSHSSGQEIARFTVCYIGNCSIDQYLGCVNESAKKVIDPKVTNVKSMDVLVQVCAEKVRLFPPRPGPLYKSFSLAEVMAVSQCSKNKRLVGLVIWKRKSLPQCHLLRCPDQLVSNALLESIQCAIQCVNESKATDKFQHSLPTSALTTTTTDNSDSLKVVYIGCVSANKTHTVSDIVSKTLSEYKPSQSQEVFLNLKLSHIELIDTTTNSVLLVQATAALQSLGVYQEEGNYLGYISGDPNKGPLTGHVLWCGTHQDTVNVATAFRQVCQVSYQQMIGKGTELDSLQPNIFSRFRSFKGSTSSPSNSPSFQSYVVSPSQLLDIPRKCKDVVSVPTIVPTVNDCSEEDFAKFCVTYVGTANLSAPFTYSSITEALDAFQEKGVAAGMAPVAKNSVEMYISSLGINLSDKKQKMFVNRNYPRKQISGCSQHLMDRKYFSFATLRPGFTDQLKVHVFMDSNLDTSDQVMKSVKFWLQLNPLTQ